MKRQDIASGGILIIDGKVLMIRRSLTDSSPGHWEFPKGRVEFAESPEDALVREFLEEVNLNVLPEKLFQVYSHTFKNREGIHVHFIEIEYLVKLADGEDLGNIKLDPDAHDQWKWVNKQQAKDLSPIFEAKKMSLMAALEL